MHQQAWVPNITATFMHRIETNSVWENRFVLIDVVRIEVELQNMDSPQTFYPETKQSIVKTNFKARNQTDSGPYTLSTVFNLKIIQTLGPFRTNNRNRRFFSI